MTNPFLQTRLQPLMFFLAAAGLLGLLCWLGPQQLPVVVYKLVMPLLGGLAGGYAWLTAAPYANPSRYLARDWRENPDADVPDGPDFAIADGCGIPFCVSLVCLTLAVCSGMLAVAWGL